MAYWLFKSEPDVFGIDHLMQRPDRTEPWDGVRNYQARNFMRDGMQAGEQGFFYHSNCAEPGIVGIVRIASESYPDPTAFDPDSKYYDAKSDPAQPRWWLVDVAFVKRFARTVSLRELKAEPRLADMRLVQRGNRLSVMPVEPAHWQTILSLV